MSKRKAETDLIPLDEAAERLGLSIDAARKRVKRRGVRNEKRLVEILVPQTVEKLFVSFEELQQCKDNPLPRTPGPRKKLRP